MRMYFTDLDGRGYERYFHNLNIEIMKFVHDDESDNGITIKLNNHKLLEAQRGSLTLELDRHELQSLLMSLVFGDTLKMDES